MSVRWTRGVIYRSQASIQLTRNRCQQRIAATVRRMADREESQARAIRAHLHPWPPPANGHVICDIHFPLGLRETPRKRRLLLMWGSSTTAVLPAPSVATCSATRRVKG